MVSRRRYAFGLVLVLFFLTSTAAYRIAFQTPAPIVNHDAVHQLAQRGE